MDQVENFKADPSILISSKKNKTKQICFTFDSGFEDNETLDILNVLKKHNIKSTFFLTGLYIEKFPELAQRIVYEGHEIGNHSYDHPRMTELSHDEIINNILKGEQIIKDILKTNPRPLFRQPYGAFNNKVLQAVGDAGYKYSIYWSIDTIDWALPPTRVIINRILRNVTDGDIILMHIACNSTAKALDISIKNLKAFGYKFVTVSELLDL